MRVKEPRTSPNAYRLRLLISNYVQKLNLLNVAPTHTGESSGMSMTELKR